MPLKLVRRHGSQNWYIRGAVRGIQVDESTGFSEKEQAEAIRARREWELITGKKDERGRPIPKFIDAFLSYCQAGGETRFLDPILTHFRVTPLEDIGQAEVETFAKKFYPGRSPATINRQVFTPIAAVLRHAHVRGMCHLKSFDRPTQPKGRVRWISPDEADRLIAASAPHLRPLVVFLLYTGARMSEALTLDWKQVDLSRAHVMFLDTKNGKDRGVPLHARVVAELAMIKGRKGEVFRTPKGDPYPVGFGGGGQIKTGFNAACRRAGIRDFHPHDCRHTWATWHYAANRDLSRLQELGGWLSPVMVSRYAHVNTAHHAASIAALPWNESGKPTGSLGKPSSENPHNQLKGRRK